MSFVGGMGTYLFLDELRQCIACHYLLVLRIVSNFFDEQRQDLRLHLNVAAENVHSVEKDVAKLIGIALTQEDLDALALAQVLLNSKLLNLLLWLAEKHAHTKTQNYQKRK